MNTREWWQRNKEKSHEYTRRYRLKNPGQHRNRYYQRMYGISLEDYNVFYEQQKGLCAICNKFQKILHVDHDHNCCPGEKTCGKRIRGLPCRKCNVGLAIVENEEFVRKSTKYLTSRKPIRY